MAGVVCIWPPEDARHGHHLNVCLPASLLDDSTGGILKESILALGSLKI